MPFPLIKRKTEKNPDCYSPSREEYRLFASEKERKEKEKGKSLLNAFE